MTKSAVSCLVFLSLLGPFGSRHAWAVDLQAGRLKAQSACAVCHGLNGVSSMPNAPHLAGQPEAYLVEQLRNYRSGKRNHEVMSVIARPLSNADIEGLSAWYSSMRVNVETP